MGVPKFFRWLSERYPKINQPFTSPPSPETVAAHFPDDSDLPPSVKSSRSIDRAKKSTSSAGGSDADGADVSDATAFSSSAPRASDAVEADLGHEHHLKCNLRPEFDRLYIDMNGIIHCCSHNNATDDDPSIDPEIHLDAAERSAASPATPPPGSVSITEEQIFHNVCYYLDRIVTDVAQPQELVYLAIDGVAPRAKMNQQRSRRYRSGKEREIEATFYEAHLASAAESSATSTAVASEIVFRGFDGDGHEDEEEDNGDFAYAGRTGTHMPGVSDVAAKDAETLAAINGQHGHDNIREVTPGRFSGTFQTTEDGLHTDEELARKGGVVDGELPATDASDVDVPAGTAFHSNTITPGTPFFDRCTAHIKDFVRRKLREDPRWGNLTIIFSGPDVPGEGEHKIMDFIRRERARADYNPNTRHCLFGQDGDLIMLGLATHEPNFCLLREEVIFEEGRKAAALAKHRRSSTEAIGSNGGSNLSASLDAYMHNANFELLHMSLLRDYLAYEFETSDVVPSSPFDIESTIDDFVFMTFFVGNDFLPHMPALDIGDEAFDLLFYTYKRHRYGWLASEMEKNDVKHDRATPYPYLTHGGNIVAGSRLEEFLSEVGSHEDPYYSNKNRKKEKELKRIRKFDEKAGREPSIPSDEALWNREEKDRERYMEMLQSIDGNLDDVDEDGAFSPVISSGQLPASSREVEDKDGVFRPEENELQVGFLDNMSRLLKNSLSSQGIAEVGGSPGSKAKAPATLSSQQKEDASASAAALEGQLTDLKGRYYYDKFGFTPVDAEKHRALRKAYIEGLVWNLEYYYKGCTSWEWYYPYHYGPMLSDLVNIDSFLEDISFDDKLGEPLRPYEQLLGCLPPSSSDLLPEPYQWLMTSRKSPIIDFYPESFTVDMNGKRWPWEAVVLLPWIDSERLLDASRNLISDDMLTEEERKRNEFGTASVFKGEEETVFEEDTWTGALTKEPVFRPEILDGTVHPLPGFPTLKDAPVQGLLRRRVGVNVFGMRSRYRTAILQMDSDLPEVPPASVLGPKFVGTTIFFRYPHLQEGFVTAVSDESTSIRGNAPLRRWTKEEADVWETRNATLNKKAMTGEGLTGTGGWLIPRSSVTLCVRPLKGIETMADGSKVKVYAKAEIEIPLATALWNPSRVDSRYASLPARLEKNPYKYVSVEDKEGTQILGRKSKRKGKGRKKSVKVPALPSFSGAKDAAPLRDEDLLPPLLSGTKDSVGPSVSILPPLEHTKDGAAALVSSSSRRGYSTLVRSGSAMVSRKERPIIGGLSQHGFTSASTTRRGFSTSTEAHSLRGTAVRSASSIRTGGGVRGKAAMTLAMATAALIVPGSHARGSDLWSSRVSINPVRRLAASGFPGTTNPRLFDAIMMKGGGTMLQDDVGVDDTMDPPSPTTPPLEHAHGTTTLSFKFKDGIVAAVDSRASIGNFIGSKTTQKVLPVSKHILGTMAGGAADCSFWIRKLRSEARKHELTMNRGISVARAAKILSQALYANRGLGLSVGTMIMGYDAHGPRIYYVDNSGTCLEGDVFSVGSGSTYALGILDAAPGSKSEMSEEEAIALGIKAIRHATYRDAYSGGYIGIYTITKEGWRKVFSEDLALSGDNTGDGVSISQREEQK